MKGILREEFFRAFTNRRYWIVALLAGMSFVYGMVGIQPIGQAGAPLAIGAVTIWQIILRRGLYGFFAALMAGLPFADSLVADRRRGYICQVLLRCTYRQYLAAKVCATLCAGLAAVSVPVLILLVVCCLAFPLTPFDAPLLSFSISEMIQPNILRPDAGWTASVLVYTLLSVTMAGLFGAAYAALGLAASLVVKNPFVVLGFPFVCYSLGVYILSTSQKLAWLVSPEAALLPLSNLLVPLLQYAGIGLLLTFCLLIFGKKERMLLES